MHPIYRYIFLISLGFNLGAWPSYSEDPTFYYLFFLFLYTFYDRLKRLFLDPDFAGSLYSSILLERDRALTWDLVVENMSSVCLFFFGRPIINQLGIQAGKRSFPQISKRYMFSRFFQGVKTNPELIGLATSLGAVSGYAVSEINQNKRNEAVVAEAKRANDLKQQELDLQKLDRNLMTKEDFLVKYPIGKVTPAIAEKPTVNCCLEESFSSFFCRNFLSSFLQSC